MFRKLAIALGASAVIAAAALSPTAASAHGGPHGHHWHGGGYHGGGFYVGLNPGYVASDCYIVRKVVWTKHGKRVRNIEVCD
jgi:uncharacterized membrane protein